MLELLDGENFEGSGLFFSSIVQELHMELGMGGKFHEMAKLRYYWGQ